MKSAIKLLQIIIIFTIIFAKNSYAIGLIRDSETEDLLREITMPLIKAANLNQSDINIYIVNDSNINAFVAAGQNIFINSGLIVRYEDPNILTGVIAHEIGHIAAGHLARGHENLNEVSKIAILSYLAGIAAAISSNSDAGYAILMGSSQVAQRLAVKHNRTQEEAADKLALQYLQVTRNSPAGLLELLKYFNREESAVSGKIDEYALTHPISQKRINFIKSNIASFAEINKDAAINRKMKYVVAKLKAFLGNNEQNLTYFNSTSPFDKYARSVIYFKKGDLKKSLLEIDSLIKSEPQNGYFYELKGQILFENGLIKEAIKSYQKAIKLLPNPALAKISLSNAILTLKTNDKELINFAIQNLKEAEIVEKNNGQIFNELSKAYFKINKKGQAYLALAELNLLQKNDKKAKEYAKLSLDNLKEKEEKSDWLKAKDILEIIKNDKVVEDS